MEGKAWEKKEWASGRNRRKWEGGYGGLTFLHNIKSSSFGELKNCIGGWFWGFLDGLKLNLFWYIIFKIKNIVIICINLSFSKKLLF